MAKSLAVVSATEGSTAVLAGTCMHFRTLEEPSPLTELQGVPSHASLGGAVRLVCKSLRHAPV